MNMGKRASAVVALAAALLAGCAGRTPPPTTPAAAPEAPPSASTGYTAMPRYGMTDIYWEPPLATSPEERAAYFVSRLSDTRFVAPGSNGPRFVAAEKLGEIGLPAVPLLLARLDTRDEYELMLALYALELATQDPLLMARTRGDAITLKGALDPNTNADNVATARQWQQQHADALALPATY
ncbi:MULTISPECIES: hypothetical protein [unclassified Halomonas]|uniref:hypothetical protein n=1 Tax=unclassified Halomonas TaxID=2609666 RepID=UPI00299F8BC9|nr:hypothetical protein [Halomonas sp. S3-1-8]